YLARFEQPTWGFALGGGYALGSNGRLGTASDGSVQGGGAGQTLPSGTQVGAFLLNGVTHTVNARTQLQLTHLRWDLSFLGTYVYNNNGIFTLAPGAPGAAPNLLNSTNLGAFVQATTHTLSPSLTYRQRVGNSGTITTSALSIYTYPIP